MVNAECPVCHGRGQVLGMLGLKAWYRCRQCGMEWNEDKDDEV